MAFIIQSCEKINASSTPSTVETACKSFLITNASDTATVYIREGQDMVPCSSDNGFPIPPKTTLPLPVNTRVLGIVATASADVYLCYGTEE